MIILDEPTAALDPRAEHDLFLHVRDLLAVTLQAEAYLAEGSGDRS